MFNHVRWEIIDLSSNVLKTNKKILNITNVVELKREIIASYFSVYDIIEFSSTKILEDQKKIIRTICYKLIGS